MPGPLHAGTTGTAKQAIPCACAGAGEERGRQRAMSSTDLLGAQARLTPDKAALLFVPTGQRYSYAELDAGSRAIAAHWTRLGLKKGDRVCMLAEPRPEYIEAFFATGKTGVVLV